MSGAETATPSVPAKDANFPDREPTHASVVDLTFAIAFAAIALLYGRALLNSDGDPARHIMIGRHIWSYGPRFDDPFSFSRAGEPFLAYEWLSQALYAGMHAVAGLPGVVLLASLLIAGALALVVAFVRRDDGDPWLAFTTGALAAVLTYPHWIARPHLFSFVALPVLLHLLVRTRRTPQIAALFLLWANLHPGFLYGLVVLLIWLAGEALEEVRLGASLRAASVRLISFPAAVLASFANPFGWSLHAHAIGWLGSTTIGLVDEFLPLDVVTGHGIIYLLAVGLLVLGLARQQQWVGWPVVLVFWAAFAAGLVARRNAPLFALFALPLTARALAPLVRTLPWPWLRGMRGEFARSDRPGWKIGAVVTVALVALLAVDARVPNVDVLPTRFSPDVFPADAVRTARERELSGRLLSKYEWGGYVLYTWPGQRIFIDSMADFFGDELIGDYATMARAAEGWRELLAEHDIALVLLAPDVPLVARLEEEPGWRVVHRDDVAVLLARADVSPAAR